MTARFVGGDAQTFSELIDKIENVEGGGHRRPVRSSKPAGCTPRKLWGNGPPLSIRVL